MTSTTTNTQTPHCFGCNKTSTTTTLLRCSRCKTATYCSKACQKVDWRSHKPLCQAHDSTATATATPQAAATLNPPRGLDSGIPNPFTALQNGTWLHNRPQNDVFRLLIDVYRLRVEDEYVYEGEVDLDSIYSGDPSVDGRAGFRRYLQEVERYKNGVLLPSWWNTQKREECIAYGGPRGQDEWSRLNCAVEKSDINEHYGDPRFAMQLRMFTETVDGRGPGGANGGMMRAMMMAAEAKGSTISFSKLDENGNFVPA